MPRSNTIITLEINPRTTLEISGVPGAGRCEMTFHKNNYVKGQVVTSYVVETFTLSDENRRVLVDALEMMR